MKKLFLFISLTIILLSLASAAEINAGNNTRVYYFYGVGCPHCANVEDSGILEKVSGIAFVQKLEVHAPGNAQKFTEFNDRFNIPEYDRGWPFLVIECNGKFSYLSGDTDIINKLEESITTCSGTEIDPATPRNITLGLIIISALIDSINPCAFGVLIFLMAALLSAGSSRRALRAGIIYSIIVFLAYLVLGLLLREVLGSLQPIMSQILFFLGIVIFIGALIEIKDFFWYGKGFSLKIPEGAKPWMQKFVHKGTLPAIMLLGVLVSLVELPCTGGIYIAILSLMSVNQVTGIGYLILYNLIFVLPLLVITFLIYLGTSTANIQAWIERNKRYMRLAAGIIMIILAVYLIKTRLPF